MRLLPRLKIGVRIIAALLIPTLGLVIVAGVNLVEQVSWRTASITQNMEKVNDTVGGNGESAAEVKRTAAVSGEATTLRSYDVDLAAADGGVYLQLPLYHDDLTAMARALSRLGLADAA